MQLYVWNADMSEKVNAQVLPATQRDFENTHSWQSDWTSKFAAELPNKVALRREDDGELLGLMSYALNESGLAVEIIYLESARHSNANLLHQFGESKKYVGIARALFAYAVVVSMEAGYDGVLYFKAKTSELREYYMQEFGAVPLGSYDPHRMIIWEDAAHNLVSDYE